MRTIWLAMWLTGCAADGRGVESDVVDTATGALCRGGGTYPEGAVEPMAVGAVLSPYRWPAAIDRRSGVTTALDLANVPCSSDDLGWDQMKALLFVSIPAW